MRYSGTNGVYGDLAYDLDRELRETELRHAGEAPRQKEAPPKTAPKVRRASKPHVRERQRLSAASVLGFLAAAVMAVMVLVNYIQLTEISTEEVRLQRELSQLESEHVALTAQYQQMFDLEAVKKAAAAANMGKPGSSQIYYVDLSGGDSAVVYQKEESGLFGKLLTSLNHGFYAVVEYFD